MPKFRAPKILSVEKSPEDFVPDAEQENQGDSLAFLGGTEAALDTGAGVASMLPGAWGFASIGLKIGAGQAGNKKLIEQLLQKPEVDSFIREQLQITDGRPLTEENFYALGDKVPDVSKELEDLEQRSNDKTGKFAASLVGGLGGAALTGIILPFTGLLGLAAGAGGGWLAGGAAEELYANNIASAKSTNRIGLLHSVCGYEQSMQEAGMQAHDETSTRTILFLTLDDDTQKYAEEKLGCRLEDALSAYMKTKLPPAALQAGGIELTADDQQMAQNLQALMSDPQMDGLLADKTGSAFQNVGAQYAALLNTNRLNIAQMVLDSPQETAQIAQQQWVVLQQQLQQQQLMAARQNLQNQGVVPASSSSPALPNIPPQEPTCEGVGPSAGRRL